MVGKMVSSMDTTALTDRTVSLILGVGSLCLFHLAAALGRREGTHARVMTRSFTGSALTTLLRSLASATSATLIYMVERMTASRLELGEFPLLGEDVIADEFALFPGLGLARLSLVREGNFPGHARATIIGRELSGITEE